MSRRTSTIVTCPHCSQERVVGGRVRRVRSCRPCALATRYDPYEPIRRFWDNVDPHNDCWLWTGSKSTAGYGLIMVRRVRVPAHRYAYELMVGPIPEGLTIDHLCRVRHCVNPAHLEPVTMTENVLRGESPQAQNARKTECPRGHAYTPENTYHLPSGSRWCRTCKRIEGREWMRKKRASVADAQTERFSLPGPRAA